MASVQETIDVLYLAHDENLISDEEFILLFDEIILNIDFKHSKFPYTEYDPFNWETYDALTCKIELRFEKDDIPHLQNALQIPEWVKFYRSSYCSGLEALCILLRRLAFPIRYCDMVPRFGRSVPDLCKITHVVLSHIFAFHRHRIENWNHPWLQPHKLAEYATAIHDKGAPLSNCFGFIDGTVRPICRPGQNQRSVYNGHKRVHSIKFQSVVFPNGLIGNLAGPYEGRKHDAGMLGESRLLEHLEMVAYSPNNEPLCLYGDPAYPLRVHLQGPFRNARLTREMEEYNKAMSSVRVTVEWLFGEIVKYFKFTDFKRQQSISLSPVGKIYIVCAILQNALTCLYNNPVSEYFALTPPTLDEYFN